MNQPHTSYVIVSHSLFKISSPGTVLYGIKWLLWCPHKQSPTFHSKCRINKGLIKRGSTIYHWRSWCKGRIIMAHPSYIHSFIPLNIVIAQKIITLYSTLGCHISAHNQPHHREFHNCTSLCLPPYSMPSTSNDHAKVFKITYIM
jgi:hypothetical protein